MKPNSTSSARPLLPAGADRGAPIRNPNVTVRREGPRRFAVWSNGHRWGHFVLRRDAEQFAVDVRAGEAFYSEAASRVVTGKVGA